MPRRNTSDQLVQSGRGLAVDGLHGGEQPRAELALDHRGDLGDFLDRRQAIEARHPRAVHGCGMASGGRGPISS
jgi:hypothetical protein